MADRTQRDVGSLAGEIVESDAGGRRDAAAHLRETGFARRVSLEKRGTLSVAAETPLADHELEAIHTAAEDDERDVRLRAVEALGDFGDARSVPLVKRLLEHDDLEVKLAALDTLGDIGGSESLLTLSGTVADAEEEEDVRLAALTELEELAAKRITSGPDRHFDPAQFSAEAQEEPEEAQSAKGELLRVCKELQEDQSVHGLLRVKAGDIKAYLESGIA
jgi:HEAT repeat protein